MSRAEQDRIDAKKWRKLKEGLLIWLFLSASSLLILGPIKLLEAWLGTD